MSQEIFSNELELSLIRGEDVTSVKFKNSTCDDFLAGFHSVYSKAGADSDSFSAVLLQDGPRWAGWTWDPHDPWVPYGLVSNKPSDGEAVTISQSPGLAWDEGKGKWKLSYQWSKLDVDFELKAIGLTKWDYFSRVECGMDSPYGAFPLCAVAVLPQALHIKGRNQGSQIPDILQVSYYLSLVGV